MSKLSPTYAADWQTDERLAHGPTSQYENEHPVLGYIRRKVAQGALLAEDAITPGTVATSALTGGARMLAGVPGMAGDIATGARMANKGLSGIYGAQAVKSGYDAATDDRLTPAERLAGAGMGLAGGVLGAVDIGAGKPLAGPMQANAEKTYARFLNPTTRDAKVATQQIVPGLLKEGGVTTSLDALSSRAQGHLDQLGPHIDQLATEIPESVKPDMHAVLGKLRDFQNGFSVNGQVVNQAGHNSAQRVIDMLSQFGDSPSFQDARGVRQILDRGVAESGGFLGKDLKDASALNAQKTAADAIRAELARQSPELDALNKKYNFYSNVRDVADASADRKTGQQGLLRTLYPLLAGGLGLSHGGAREGLGALAATGVASAYTTPFSRTLRATAKSRVAQALSGSDIGDYGRLAQRAIAGVGGQ